MKPAAPVTHTISASCPMAEAPVLVSYSEFGAPPGDFKLPECKMEEDGQTGEESTSVGLINDE